MFGLPTKTQNALEILKISFKIARLHSLLWWLIIAHILFTLGTIFIFFALEYYYFGISAIDFSTFSKVANFRIVTHLLQTSFIFICVVAIEFFSSVMSYVGTYEVMRLTRNETSYNYSCITLLYNSSKELLRHAFIMACEHFKWIFSWFSVTTHLEALQDICDQSYEVAVRKYQKPLTILLYPLLIENPGIILKKIRYQSIEMLQNKFTEKAEQQYTFASITFFTVVAIWFVMYLLYSHHVVSSLRAFLTGIVIITLYVSIMRILVTIFEVAVYQYCKEGTQYLYPQALMNLLFKPVDQHAVNFSEKK